jgi:hypothetical protein
VALLETLEGELVNDDARFLANPWNQIRAYRWEDGKIPTLVLQFSYGFSRFGIARQQKGLIAEVLQNHFQTVTNSQQPQGEPLGSEEAPVKTGGEQRMKEPYRKGVAIHLGPESCAGGGNTTGEALTGGNTGRVFSSEIKPPACRPCSDMGKAT